MSNIEIAQADEVIITTLEELGPVEPTTEQIMRFDAAMSEDTQGLGHSLLKEVSDIQKTFKTAKSDLHTKLAVSVDNPNDLMLMQWSLIRITIQEELIAKTAGRMSQNVETLSKGG